MTRSRLVGALIALALAAPGAARANGRFPATVDIHFKPGDHQVMGLQVTFGMLQTEDGGASWHWMCEDAVGFGGVYDPDYTYEADGTLWATTTSVRGLAFTEDHCTWSPAPADLAGDPATFVSHIEVGSDGTIYALASTFTDAQLHVSTDGGASFQVRSLPGGGVDWWESMEVAPLPANQTRLYISGYSFINVPHSGAVKKRRHFRSDNGGQTWTELPTNQFHFTHATLPDLQYLAVSPLDPDVVWVRIKKVNGLGIGDDIYRSGDAGVTWTRVFSSGDDVTALVPRANGQVILAERLTGIHLSSDDGITFGASLPDSPEIDCMKERDDGLLFACSKSFQPDSMALGTSSDAQTWTPILTFDQIADAYPSCPTGTAQRDTCADNRWCCIVHQFGITDAACDGICLAPVVDAGVGGDGSNMADDDDDGGGTKPTCCSAGTPGEAAFLGLLVALPLVRRRRR